MVPIHEITKRRVLDFENFSYFHHRRKDVKPHVGDCVNAMGRDDSTSVK